jgi:hypothetical protein
VTDRRRRALVLAVAAVVVAGASVADALTGVARTGSVPAPASAVLAGPGATSSAWYCAGVAAAPSGTQAFLLVADPEAHPLTGTVDTVPVGSQVSAPQSFSVPPGQEVTIPVVTGAATVLSDGAAAVEQVLTGPLGSTTAPCSSTTAGNWFFAQGSTASGDGLQVALYDPLPTPAVVDVSFVSQAGGVVAPPAYQGVPLAPGTVVVENVADHVPGDPALATEVKAVTGAVAASEVAETAGSGQGGLSLVDGVSAVARRWACADNADLPGGGNWYGVLNPFGRPATVTVSVVLSEGKAAPITLQVPAQSLASFVAQDQTRIPAGTLFGLTFSVSRGPGVVVGRLAASGGTGMPASGISAAQPAGVRRWLVPAVAPSQLSWGLALVDMVSRPVHVRIEGFGPGGRFVAVPGRSSLIVEPGTFEVVRAPGTPVGLSPTVVLADGAVAVQLDPLPAGPPGIDPVPAWPFPG